MQTLSQIRVMRAWQISRALYWMLLVALFRRGDTSLQSWGSNVCTYYSQASYYTYYSEWYSCGTWGWGNCYRSIADTKYYSNPYYECCSGWHQANYWDASCTKAKCYSYAVGTCDNGGTCESPNSCRCPTWGNFHSSDCSDVKECSSNNGGCEDGCSEKIGSFECYCWNGRGLLDDGKSCAYICYGQPPGHCLNGGTCTDTDTCSCAENYYGYDCSDFDECSVDNGGCSAHCHNTADSYYCSCDTGFELASDQKACQDVDECAGSHDCTHICSNDQGSYWCSCREGYYLHSDQRACYDIDECSDNNGDCQQTCSNTEGSFLCDCDTGFSLVGDGLSCEDIDECEANPLTCTANGDCLNTEGSFTCACHPGYEPHSDLPCTDTDECAVSNGGCGQTCSNSEGSYTCSCQDLYELASDGHSCEDIDECSSSSGGCDHTCVNMPGSFSCSCDSGYDLGFDGFTCSDIDECASLNGGCDDICSNSAGSFTCSCYSGYQLGSDDLGCLDIDECSSSNGGCAHVCQNSDGSYGCSCNSGYKLLPDEKGCSDINECEESNGGCEHICSNSPGSFTCSCNLGFELDSDNKDCSDVDECSANTDGCSHICTNNIGSFQCSCESGYFLLSDGKTCSDVDECDLQLDGCSQVCNNNVGSFTCSCNVGYALAFDGKVCDDVNECSKGSHDCTQQCQNVQGSFTCSCLIGYTLQGDGRSCSDDDECALNTDGCGQNCHNSDGSFTCSCNTGYSLQPDSKTCSDINECSLDNGGCSQLCQNSQGSFTCSCNTGYLLQDDGSSCQDVIECDTPADDCAHFCLNTAGSYTCNCDSGFETSDGGKTCTDVDECLVNNGDCDHNCHNNVGAFTCSCNSGYSTVDAGFTCSDDDECVENNGQCAQICTNEPGSWRCSCEVGYITEDLGLTCTDIDECQASNGDCAHNCHNLAGSFSCSCQPGYRTTDAGFTCHEINECSEDTDGCDHTCSNTPGSFSCSCNPGYDLHTDGKSCQDVDECLSSYGGCGQECNNNPGSYTCSCGSGYILEQDGKSCADVNECDADNGGCDHLCHNRNGNYFCSCRTGYDSPDAEVTCNDIDECGSDNGGCDQTCHNSAGSYWCSCSVGYSLQSDGHACLDIDECSHANGGCSQTCTNSLGSFECSCLAGYDSPDEGVTCTDIDECQTSNGNCAQNCHNSGGSYSCSCNSGYVTQDSGVSCTDVDECSTANGGCAHTCTNSPGGYVCSCNNGFNPRDDAKFCDDIDECAVNNGGCSQTCANSAGDFQCSCLQGYESNDGGISCFDVEECGAGNGGCQHNCHNSAGGFSCTCNSGFVTTDQGITCTDVDECQTDNGGCEHTCANRPGSFQCSCEHGFNPVEQAKYCHDIDECSNNNGDCQHICTNAPGSYNCSCRHGYIEEDHGKTCYDIEECAVDNGGCDHNCHNTLGSFSCSCDSGYSTLNEGFTCTDIDECATDNGGCSQNCHNAPGYFSCSCDPGYSTPDDGVTCNNIDECATDNGGCSHMCEDSPGSFTCKCRPGYDSPDNQVSCFDIDECLTSNGGCSHNCHNADGSHSCACRSGYYSNDDHVTCLDVDECQTDNGGCSQNCHNSPGSFSCSCNQGYDSTDNQVTCNDIDECSSNNGDCDHECHNMVPLYYCTCRSGFSSPDNQVSCFDIDECATDSGGCSQNCHNTEGSSYCTCRPGYDSLDNQVTCFDIDECDTNNGGCSQTCSNTKGSYFCSCLTGYSSPDNGVSCYDVDECTSNNGDCAHQCNNSHGSYKCSCLSGYSTPDQARTCYDIDECATNNGGCNHNCHDADGSFSCTCRQGYNSPDHGFTCQDINECAVSNGGCQKNCHNIPGSFSCSCEEGFTTPDWGVTCNDIDECAKMNGQCEHSCHNWAGGYECLCDQGYSTKDEGITCNDIIECGSNSGGCSHTCTNTDGSFICSCNQGFYLLPDRRMCEDTDECATANGNCDQVCTNEESSYTCSCLVGYLLDESDEKTCHDIEECSSNNGGCTHTCTNSDGSFTCTCNEGYYLQTDQKTCLDIDECSNNNGGCTHNCENNESSYSCDCNTGFFLLDDDKTCQDTDECAVDLGGCAERCVNSPGSYLCTCEEGRAFDLHGICQPVCYDYVPGECGVGGLCRSPGTCDCKHGYEPIKCQDINECAVDNGNCTGKCVNRPGSYYCACEQGFYLEDGHTCVDVDECSGGMDICSHTCVNLYGTFRCECPTGYKLQLATYTCQFCLPDDLDCWPECAAEGGDCVCEDSFSLHKDGQHCIASCPCRNGGVCVSGYPDFVCNCSGTDYKGAVCEVGSVDIPERLFFHYGYQKMTVQVRAMSDKALVLLTTTSEELTLDPSQIVIPPQSGGNNFTLEGSRMGLYTVNIKLAGSGYKLFEPPKPISVLVGDVFVRLQLSHKQFPLGCFPIEFSVPSQTSSGNSTVFRFVSTSQWYKVEGSELLFFTLGVPMTDTVITYPVSPRGVEIITSDGKIRLGPISSLRESSRGMTLVNQTEESDCEEIPLSREDKLDFDKAQSALQTLLRRVAGVLPEGFDLSISRNPTPLPTDDFRANIHRGSEVQTLQVCSGVPLLDDSLYYVFQFSTSEFSFYLLNEELTLPAARFCVIVDLMQDSGQTVVFLSDQPIPLMDTGLLAPLSSSLGLNVTITGMAFSASGVLRTPLGEGSPWKKLLPSSSPSVWVGLKVTSEDNTALQVASAGQAYFFDKPAESKLQTHLILADRSFLLSLRQPFAVHLQLEAHEQTSMLTVRSTDVENFVTVVVGGSGCSRKGKQVTVNFLASTEKLTSKSGVEILGGSQVNVVLDGVAEPSAMFSSADADPFLNHLKAFRHTLDTLVKSESQIIDDFTHTEFSYILQTLLGLQHDVQSLLIWEDVSEVREFADKLVILNTAVASVRHRLDTIEDHLYLTLQPELQERLGFATFFLSKVESELRKLTSKLHKVTVQGLSESSSWGATGLMSIRLQDSAFLLTGNLSYSASGECCPAESLCDASGRGLELQVSGSVQSHSVTSSSVWTKNIWQFVEVRPGAALTYGLGRKDRSVKATLTDRVILRAFGMDAPATVNIEDEQLVVDSAGQVFDQYPANVQLRGSPLRDAVDWALSAYVQLLLGKDSFPEELRKALNTAVQENISRTTERLETAEENLKRAEFKLQLETESLNVSQVAYDDLLQELKQVEWQLDQATAELAEANHKMYSFRDKVKLLTEVCEQKECNAQCKVSPDMKVCESNEGEATSDLQVKYPCLVWEECLISMSNYMCHVANLVCYNVQKQVLIANEGFDSKEFLQTWFEYADVKKKVAKLKLELLELKMAAKSAESILTRGKSRYDLLNEVMEARQVEVDDLVKQKQSTAYLTAHSNTHSQNLFQVKSCAFGDELNGMHVTLFELRCKINSLQTGWIWYTFNNDFAKTENSLAVTAAQVFDRFHSRVQTASDSGQSMRRKREVPSTLEVLNQIATNSSLDTVVGTPGEQQWNDTCSLYKAIFSFLFTSVQSLQHIVKAYVNEVILATERIDDGIVSLQLNSSLSLEDGEINKSALSAYGVNLDELAKLLAAINPRQDPLIGHLINTSKILTDMNMDVVSAISHYDILTLWLRQMDNLTALYDFRGCSGYQDCIKWAFDWYAARVAELDPSILSADHNVTEAQTLFILLIHNEVPSMEEVTQVTEDISQRLRNNSIGDILCGSKPTFADRDLRNISVALGQNVTLRCGAEGTPTPGITWWRIGSPDPLQNKSYSQDLQLARVIAAQEGEYYCVADNYIGSTVSPSTMLQVGYPPEVTSHFSGNVDLLVGDSLTLTCEATGRPEPKISWLSSSSESLSIVNSSYYQHFLKVSHSGLYKCQAENLYGQEESDELYIRVRQATAVCPSTAIKMGYIVQPSESSVSDTGVVVDAPDLEDYFSAAVVLIAQNREGAIIIRDLSVKEVDHSIEFSVGMSTCESKQNCQRSSCKEQYTLHTQTVQSAIDALTLAVYNDTYMFTRDGQAYYLNSALLEVQAAVKGCPSGHELTNAYVCASADAVVRVLPPENLRSLQENSQPLIVWDMNQHQKPFIQGYEVVLEGDGKTVVNETVNTTRLLVSEDLADHHYRVLVRAFTRSYYSDWVQEPITLASTGMSESSYIWVIGVVFALLLVLLVIMYLTYCLKKSHIGPSREASVATLSSSMSGSRFSLELAPSKMKHFTIPQGVRGSAGVLSSDGSVPSTNTSLLTASESASRECILGVELPYYSEDPADDLPEAVRDDGPWDLKPQDIIVGTDSVDTSTPQ